MIRGETRDSGERFTDLHVHTTASHDEISWPYRMPLQPLMTPLEVYTIAKERGMDFVTFTDHDTIDGALELERTLGGLPDDFFISEEVTCSHPELEHEIHVNVFDITPKQHEEIQALPRVKQCDAGAKTSTPEGADESARIARKRIDITCLVAYLQENNIIYAWNHPVWNEDCTQFKRGTLQLLSPFFQLIEVRNGTRRPHLCKIAEGIAQREMKGVVAGSDSHSDEVGMTYTGVLANDKQGFLEGLRRGEGRAHGQSGTYERFVRDAVLLCRVNLQRLAEGSSSAFKRLTYRLGSYVLPKMVPIIASRYHAAQDESLKDILQEQKEVNT
jgi:hypothetical protein